VGTVLAIALAWLAIQHHAGPAGIADDYQSIMRNTGHAPDLGAYVSLEYLQDGVGLPIVFSLLALTLQGLSATLGGWIGAALWRADERGQRAARPDAPETRPVTFLVAVLALGLLAWVTTAEFNALGAAHRLLGPGDLGMSVVTQPFALWLLGCLVAFAFALVGGRTAAARPAVESGV
jgi:hypothetical protein